MAKNLTRKQVDAPTNFPEPPLGGPAEAAHEPVKEFAGQPGPKAGKTAKTIKTDHGAVRTDLV